MQAPMIQIEGMAKRYRIGAQRERYSTVRESLAGAASTSWARLRRASKGSTDHIWALKGVDLQIDRGELVGIIGHNGAGKSTLLKILSRITEPTQGGALIRGRVGSLLEVGTGFHNELTGRENIFLNGAILGMRRSEIERKLDEIVSFSGVGKFIDTPVKRYSSGMFVRLAFSVAAHLETEVLLVDEVLAVGDAEFQKKCLGKLDEAATEGRTVLFVSHNMAAIQRLCRRGIVLKDGAVWKDQDITPAIDGYLSTLAQAATTSVLERPDRQGAGDLRVADVEVSSHGSTGSVATGGPARFVFHLTAPGSDLKCMFTIFDRSGSPVANFNTSRQGPDDRRDPALGTKVVCEMDEFLLSPGRYRLDVALVANGVLQDHVNAAVEFDVEQGTVRGRPTAPDGRYGSVCLDHRWVLPERAR